jgi:hypothetical protein
MAMKCEEVYLASCDTKFDDIFMIADTSATVHMKNTDGIFDKREVKCIVR